MRLKLNDFTLSLIIFSSFFFTRYIFLFLNGADNFELQPDSYWYSEQSDEVLKGNFNLLRPLFITSPFFTYLQSIIKFIFSDYWMISLEFLQVFIASVSGVYFYHLSNNLFSNIKISTISTFIFCFYPFTIWFVGTFTQDIWFQSFLVIFFYYFTKYLNNKDRKNLIISALLFSLTFLTKSHILIYSLFIPIIIFFINIKSLKIKFLHIIYFTAICLISTLPYGIYNLKVNGVYVLSSNGFGGLFILGHNDDAYINHVKTPKLGTLESNRLKSVEYKIFKEIEYKIKNAEPKDIQMIYFAEGVEWIKKNKKKSKKLLQTNLKRFFTPGLNKSWYNNNIWIVSFLVSFPIMLLGYLGLIKVLILNFSHYSWILYLILTMLLFSLIFYFQGRFRIITLDPIFILLCAYSINDFFLKKNKLNDKI